MCGIIAEFNKEGNNANEFCINQYEEQHSRGSQGFGVVRIDGNKKHEVLRSTEGAKFMYDLHSKKVRSMLVHHRYPTSSPNYLGQTHPISVDHESLEYKYLVVHNGIISNDDDLKAEHEKLGFQYTTDIQIQSKYNYGGTTKWEDKFNDSEAIAIELARFIENKSNIVGAMGAAALVALQIDKLTNKVTKVYFCRNASNPLAMTFNKGRLRLSSEGEGDDIKPDTLYSWNFENNKLKKRAMKFKTYTYVAPKSPYPHSEIGFGGHSTTYSAHPAGSPHSTPVYSGDWFNSPDYKEWKENADERIFQGINDPMDTEEELNLILEEGRSEVDSLIDDFYARILSTSTDLIDDSEVELMARAVSLTIKNTADEANKHISVTMLDAEEQRAIVPINSLAL